MPYIITDEKYAEELNRSFYSLLRPDHLRDANYVTEFYTEVIRHPDTGKVAINLPDIETIPVHQQANTTKIDAILSTMETDGKVTRKESQDAKTAIVANRGRETRVIDMVPTSLKSDAKTKKQLEADGWFPEQEETP